MGYEASIKKAWEALRDPLEKKGYIGFLSDEYEIDFENRRIFSLSCNVEAKDHYKILILHYLASQDKVTDIGRDDWISFKELEGGDAYFPAFRKRSIEPILRKYGDNPRAIFERVKALNAEKMDTGSAGISVTAFPKIKVGVILWAKDEDFGADCNMLFNRSAKDILPTEDLTVLGSIIASLI